MIAIFCNRRSFWGNNIMRIITQGIEKITYRWDGTLNMVKYNYDMKSEAYFMKKIFKYLKCSA